MKSALIIVLLVVIASPVRAENKRSWTAGDTILQLTFSAVHAMDWSQTLYIARNPCTDHETNPVLGEHPSKGRVNSYFASTLVLHTAISYVLPKPYRTIWQVVWIGGQAVTVKRNIDVGIKIHF